MLMAMAQLELDLAMFREGGSSASAWRLLGDPRSWALLVAIAGAAVTVLALNDLARRDRAAGGPTARLLAHAIGLNRSDLRLLRFLAHRSDFPSAACLMISRGCFDRAAQRAAIGIDDRVIRRLRGQLFDNSHEPVHSLDERHRDRPTPPRRPSGPARPAHARRRVRAESARRGRLASRRG